MWLILAFEFTRDVLHRLGWSVCFVNLSDIVFFIDSPVTHLGIKGGYLSMEITMDMNRRELLKQKLMAAAALGLAGVAGNAIAQQAGKVAGTSAAGGAAGAPAANGSAQSKGESRTAPRQKPADGVKPLPKKQ